MSRSLLWLRILVVVQWAARLAGMAIASVYWDVLPPPLRDYDSGAGAMLDVSLAWALRMLAFALAVGGSAGVVLAWPPARLVYTAGALLALPTAVLQGHVVSHGYAAPLYGVAWLANGAALALLWFSPAAQVFGSAPETLAMRADDTVGRTVHGVVILAVGALAGIGALVIASAAATGLYFAGTERARLAGADVGKSGDDSACVSAALERAREGTFEWFDNSFLSSCLSVAGRSDALCATVPIPYPDGDDVEIARFTRERCEGQPDHDACVAIYGAVQWHCHPPGEVEGVLSDSAPESEESPDDD
jgi:hypothetical protein